MNQTSTLDLGCDGCFLSGPHEDRKTLRYSIFSLRSKRFHSSYSAKGAKVGAGAKRFLLSFQFSRRNSRGAACYAGYSIFNIQYSNFGISKCACGPLRKQPSHPRESTSGSLHCSQLKFSMWLKYPDLWHFFRWTYGSFPSFLLGRKSPSNTSLSYRLKAHENRIRIQQYTVIPLHTVLPTFEKNRQAKNYRNHWKMSLEINNIC